MHFFFLLIGLFTADQNVRITGGSTCTRQNPNGMRRGFECPEERDYFPYWHPTVWVDIFVYAQNASMCDYYKNCLLYTSPSPRDATLSRMPSSA